MPAVSTEYLSTGANRQTAVADWHRDGLVAFGADINVALWEPTASPPRGVTRLLSGHTETVKAVQFLPGAEGDTSVYLVTGGDDKSLVVWKAAAGSQDFTVVQRATDHQGAINCVASLRVSSTDGSPRWLLVTGSADATIKVWEFGSVSDAVDQLRLVQSIKTMPKVFPLSLALSPLDQDGNVLVLAAGGTKDTIQVFTADNSSSTDGPQFSLQARLAGHESWIRSLNFTRESLNDPASDLLLASASQDKYIRIWRVREGIELPARAVEGADSLSGAYLPGKSPSNKAHRLHTAGRDFSVTFEALLLGHEDWIYSARWCHDAPSSDGAAGTLRLLSTSADNSLAIWEADPDSGIWVSTVRLGEISREKGATTATGSTGGFWTGLWSPDGRSVACLGRTGSWRRWQHDADEDTWRPCVAITGHTRAVTGIAWSAGDAISGAGAGDYLLSTSLDQTTRLHTTWSGAGTDKPGPGTWHEMSRPQIHGYDMNCIDALGPSQFVSGADEKLMRVFGEPKAVASMLQRLAGLGLDGADGGAGRIADMPDAANMPVLGLSNKAIDAVGDDDEIEAVDDRDREAMDPASVVKRSYLDIDHPPYEETLSRHTLWPETEKLYGHGYEMSCLAASHDGRLVASACRASSTNHAVIRLFETERWTELRPPLTAHSLTATRLRFSPDDAFLLSVGRDRQWAVFARAPQSGEGSDEGPGYALAQSNPKGHSRMILDAAWAPFAVADGRKPLFATAGRDKQVRIWASAEEAQGDDSPKFAQTGSIVGTGPITAVDFLSWPVNGKYVLAVGSESGQVGLHLVDCESHAVAASLPPTDELTLPKTILQLSWRPRKDADTYQLAVAGEDSSLRLLSFDKDYLAA